jgi:hypothetical protein
MVQLTCRALDLRVSFMICQFVLGNSISSMYPLLWDFHNDCGLLLIQVPRHMVAQGAGTLEIFWLISHF